jgi:DMSO reductase anchor subunit
MDTQTVVAIAAPLIALQLLLIVIALRDLVRPERRVRGVSKLVWGIVIVLGELIGPLVYFAIGRDELEL